MKNMLLKSWSFFGKVLFIIDLNSIFKSSVRLQIQNPGNYPYTIVYSYLLLLRWLKVYWIQGLTFLFKGISYCSY